MKNFIKFLIVFVILIILGLVGILVVIKTNGQNNIIESTDVISSLEITSNVSQSSNINSVSSSVNSNITTGTMLKKLVANKMANKKYTVKMKVTYQGNIADYILSINGENLYLETIQNGVTSSILMMDEYMYVIYPLDETYTKVLVSEAENIIEDPFIKAYIANTLPTGIVSIDSTDYYCEIVSLDNGGEDRYCFDNNGNLVYIVSYTKNETTSELEVLEISQVVYIADTVDETLFAEPERYTNLSEGY